MPIEGVHIVILSRKEALVREILLISIHLDFGLPENPLLLYVVEKVMVPECGIVEQVDKNNIICAKCACDVWIGEAIDRHREVVHSVLLGLRVVILVNQLFVDV